jgi:hypothetical protein
MGNATEHHLVTHRVKGKETFATTQSGPWVLAQHSTLRAGRGSSLQLQVSRSEKMEADIQMTLRQ